MLLAVIVLQAALVALKLWGVLGLHWALILLPLEFYGALLLVVLWVLLLPGVPLVRVKRTPIE